MSSIPVNPYGAVDLEAILAGMTELDTPSLEAFADKIHHIIAKRKAPSLSQDETRLLLMINKSIPEGTLIQFHEFQKIQKERELTPIEQKELEQLVDEIEMKEAERLENMITLAALWEISVEELRKRLEIKIPEPNVW